MRLIGIIIIGIIIIGIIIEKYKQTNIRQTCSKHGFDQ